MPRKPFPPRPPQDFRITSLKSQLSIQLNHRNAGFPVVPEETIRRRFWQYLRFLGLKGYLVKSPPAEVAALTADAELRSFDLTDDGYRFEQQFGDKWLERTYKDKGFEVEQSFLEKWHNKFLAASHGEA